MHRIAKRIAGSFVYCVLAWGGASACASEDATFQKDAGKACAAFCPGQDMFKGCCLNTGVCGVDLGQGQGCVPVKKDSGN